MCKCHEWKMVLYIIFHCLNSSVTARVWKHFLVLFRHNTELCFTIVNKQRHRIWLHWQTSLVPVVFERCARQTENGEKKAKLFWNDQSLRSAELSEISSFNSDKILGMLRLKQLTLANHFEFRSIFWTLTVHGAELPVIIPSEMRNVCTSYRTIVFENKWVAKAILADQLSTMTFQSHY